MKFRNLKGFIVNDMQYNGRTRALDTYSYYDFIKINGLRVGYDIAINFGYSVLEIIQHTDKIKYTFRLNRRDDITRFIFRRLIDNNSDMAFYYNRAGELTDVRCWYPNYYTRHFDYGTSLMFKSKGVTLTARHGSKEIVKLCSLPVYKLPQIMLDLANEVYTNYDR